MNTGLTLLTLDPLSTSVVDNSLLANITRSAAAASLVVSSVLLASIVQPYFLIAVAIVAMGYMRIAHFFGAGNRDIKRLLNLARSDYHAHVSESISGLPTIIAANECQRFLALNQAFVDRENRWVAIINASEPHIQCSCSIFYLTITDQRWLALRCDLLAALLTLAACLICVIRRAHLTPSQVGVAVSSILAASSAMPWLVRNLVQINLEMNSVQRELLES